VSVCDVSNVSTTIDPYWDISLDLGPPDFEGLLFLIIIIIIIIITAFVWRHKVRRYRGAVSRHLVVFNNDNLVKSS